MAEDKEQEKQKTKCPCCGANTYDADPNIDNETVDHFLSCIMTGVSFWKEYKLFDGRLSIEITIPRNEKRDELFATLTKLQNFYTPQGQSEHMLLTTLLGRFLYVRKITFDKKLATERVYDIAKHVDNMCAVIQQKCDDILALPKAKLPALQDVYKQLLMKTENTASVSGVPTQLLDKIIEQHNALYKQLVTRGLDQPFWKGIKLA